VPGALLNAAVEHARERRYRRLLLAPTAGSAAFYRRAGFVPAAESLLSLDPSAP
jgi:predicted N-acetyltransferase YhbS